MTHPGYESPMPLKSVMPALQTTSSPRHTSVQVAPGIALTTAPGVVVVAVLEQPTRKLFAAALEALQDHRRHPLDIAAIALPPHSPPLAPRTVQRLAESGVVIADASGESAVERAENYAVALADARNNGREHLRAFVEYVRHRNEASWL